MRAMLPQRRIGVPAAARSLPLSCRSESSSKAGGTISGADFPFFPIARGHRTIQLAVQEELSILGIEADHIGRKHIGGEVRRNRKTSLRVLLATRLLRLAVIGSARGFCCLSFQIASAPRRVRPIRIRVPTSTGFVRWSWNTLACHRQAAHAGRRTLQGNNKLAGSLASPANEIVACRYTIRKRRCLAPATPSPRCTATALLPTARLRLSNQRRSHHSRHSRHRIGRLCSAAQPRQPPHPWKPPHPRARASASAHPRQPPHPRASCTPLRAFSSSSNSWKVARLTSVISSSPSVIIMPGAKFGS